MQVPARRLVAFIIDYLLVIVAVCIAIAILLVNNTSEDVLINVAGAICFVMLIMKDSLGGASIGKRIMGIAIRKYSNAADTPNIIVLAIRNLLICLWPIELLVFIVDHEHRRLSDRMFDVTVIDNRGEAR